MYTHLKEFGSRYKTESGTPDYKKIHQNPEGVYCDFDTYMGVSTYNHLREMLNLPEISLKEDEYAIHMKERVFQQVGDFSDQIVIENEGQVLTFAGCYTESFSQDGHNGGDYILVVPDKVLKQMRKYYAEMVADIQGKAPETLQTQLDDIEEDRGKGNAQEFAGTEEDFEDWEERELENFCSGSDSIVVYASKNLVRDNFIPEVKYMLSSIIFPLSYIGLVFLCVSLTVLWYNSLAIL